MDKNLVEKNLYRAAKDLLENQKNFSLFTSETSQTEWNIAHHLANEISRIFPQHYDCDLDLIKPNMETGASRGW